MSGNGTVNGRRRPWLLPHTSTPYLTLLYSLQPFVSRQVYITMFTRATIKSHNSKNTIGNAHKNTMYTFSTYTLDLYGGFSVFLYLWDLIRTSPYTRISVPLYSVNPTNKRLVRNCKWVINFLIKYFLYQKHFNNVRQFKHRYRPVNSLTLLPWIFS